MADIEPVDLGGVMVGDAYPAVLVAEVGTFFHKDIALARPFLEAVARAGAPVFECYPRVLRKWTAAATR